MRHKKKNKPQGRHKVRYKSLRIMSGELIRQGSVVSTQRRGNELRKYLEPLIKKSKGGESLANRRLLISRLGDKEVVNDLYEQAKKIKGDSGFIRLTKLPRKRGDGAVMTRIDIMED